MRLKLSFMAAALLMAIIFAVPTSIKANEFLNKINEEMAGGKRTITGILLDRVAQNFPAIETFNLPRVAFHDGKPLSEPKRWEEILSNHLKAVQGPLSEDDSSKKELVQLSEKILSTGKYFSEDKMGNPKKVNLKEMALPTNPLFEGGPTYKDFGDFINELKETLGALSRHYEKLRGFESALDGEKGDSPSKLLGVFNKDIEDWDVELGSSKFLSALRDFRGKGKDE